MSHNYIEVPNKTKLLHAVAACPHDSQTVIINKRADGSQTKFTIEPQEDAYRHTLHLGKIRGRIRRTPAHVWR